jgi:hypothetical protein
MYVKIKLVIRHDMVEQRERHILSIRHEKVFNKIMEKRFSEQNQSEIKLEELEKNIPLDLRIMLKKSEDKIDLIRKWINGDVSDITGMEFDDLQYELKKYAIVQLRSYSEDYQNEEGEELLLDNDFINELLREFFELGDKSFTHELSIILLNFAFNSKTLSKYLLDSFIIQKIFLKTHSTNSKLVDNILVMVGNLIIDHGISEQLIYSLSIANRVKETIQSGIFPKSVVANSMRLLSIVINYTSDYQIVISY